MSKKKTLLCILFCCLGCSAQHSGVYETFYKSGILKSVQSFENGTLNGISREYYETGTLKHAIHYKNDEMNGIYNTYYPNGALWTNEMYIQGNIVSRKEFNEEGELVIHEAYYQE